MPSLSYPTSRYARLVSVKIDPRTVFQEVRINYLVAGHTHMEVDSMHAAIEVRKRSTGDVYDLTGWKRVILNAKVKNPYKVRSEKRG